MLFLEKAQGLKSFAKFQVGCLLLRFFFLCAIQLLVLFYTLYTHNAIISLDSLRLFLRLSFVYIKKMMLGICLLPVFSSHLEIQKMVA